MCPKDKLASVKTLEESGGKRTHRYEKCGKIQYMKNWKRGKLILNFSTFHRREKLVFISPFKNSSPLWQKNDQVIAKNISSVQPQTTILFYTLLFNRDSRF